MKRQKLSSLTSMCITQCSVSAATLTGHICPHWGSRLDLFNIITISAELRRAGGVHMNYDYYTARLYSFFDSSQPSRIITECIVIAFFIYFTIEVIMSLKRKGMRSFFSVRASSCIERLLVYLSPAFSPLLCSITLTCWPTMPCGFSAFFHTYTFLH